MKRQSWEKVISRWTQGRRRAVVSVLLAAMIGLMTINSLILPSVAMSSAKRNEGVYTEYNEAAADGAVFDGSGSGAVVSGEETGAEEGSEAAAEEGLEAAEEEGSEEAAEEGLEAAAEEGLEAAAEEGLEAAAEEGSEAAAEEGAEAAAEEGTEAAAETAGRPEDGMDAAAADQEEAAGDGEDTDSEDADSGYPDAEDGIPEEAEETEEAENPGEVEEGVEVQSADAFPAQIFEASTEHVAVHVDAEEGALPAGVTMEVTEVTDEDVISSVRDAASDETGSAEAEDVRAVDISFVTEQGEKVEPLLPVRVVLTSDLVEKAENPVVVHVDDEGETEVVELLEETDLEETLAVDQVAFDSERFSVYAIVGKIEKIVLAGDGLNYRITASIGPETGIPENADLEVSEILPDADASTGFAMSYEEYVARTESALGMEEGSAGYIRLFDISIVDRDDRSVMYQPAEGTSVDVRIELADSVSEELSVVHFEEGEAGESVVDSAVDGQAVSFAAEGFSVYAVVGDGEDENESRAIVHFYGKDTDAPIATVYVKNLDTADELTDIVFDPGCGALDDKELFDGWVISTVNTTDGSAYTIDTEGGTIEDVRAYLEQLEIQEGDVVNIYAKIVKTITISYIGEAQDIILGSNIIKVLGDDSAEYEISMSYTPETAEQAFMGWNVSAGASNIQSAVFEGEAAEAPYQNGTAITVNGDVTLSVNAPYGHWLVFDENGKGATYNAPQFIEEGEMTREPSGEMLRLGYTFGGWYTDRACTPGNEFTFGSELTDNTTIYAKWTETGTANYTVIVWKERMTDTYAENGGTGEGKEKNYDFSESFTLTGTVGSVANAVSNGTSSVVDGDPAGTRYYDARIRGTGNGGETVNQTVSYTGYHCADYDTDVEITPEGNAVINVYYDRNTVKYTFYTYGESSSGEGTWWLVKENGDQIIQSGRYAGRDFELATRSGNRYDQFTGTVAHDDGRTYYYSTTGNCGGTYMREAHWELVSGTTSQWNVYQEETGLYGENLNWPADSSIWWYEGHNSTRGTGTRMTYKDAFLPNDGDMTVEYWGNSASASGTIHFWTQDVTGGDSYTDRVQVATGNANFSINDKFTGFYAYQYRTDNGAWNNVGAYDESTGIYGSPVDYNNRLDIRYKRIMAAITFLDGSYFDGNGNRLKEDRQAEAFYTSPEYYYEADVSAYNRDGELYYTPPDREGYTFAGWYADDACTVEYDFNNMPATGITVYAKWIQNQYRVFLHPNVPESDSTLNWGSENQAMNFRVSSGETVSTPTGTRSGYKLIGWYLDEACTQVFDSEHYLLNDTSVTTPYDKTADMTDEMNKYGNIVGEGTNSDAQNDRFWINRKLDLYAKWRAELIGADGIGVKYDANGGSNTPNDTNLYLDNSDTVAQGAPTPPDDSLQFLHWVLQRWDEEAGKYVDIEGAHNQVHPGDTFTVLKSNARVEELEGSTEEVPKYRYTVQLRAEYGPKDAPTPTHIWWFPNNEEADRHAAAEAKDDLQINESVTIPGAPERDGYEFLGWARIPEEQSESRRDAEGAMPTGNVLDGLTDQDLFLTYHKAEGENAGYYTAVINGTPETVTKVAADETEPYHDLYAVWEKKKYTVTVEKIVHGFDSDSSTPFTFRPHFENLPSDPAYSDYNSEFRLVGNPEGADVEEDGASVHYQHTVVYQEVPYDTVFNITETPLPEFAVYEAYEIENADNGSENKSVLHADNGVEITVKGDVTVRVYNTRKSQPIRVLKTDIDGRTPLGGAVFTISIDGTDYTLTSGDDGYLKNESISDGIIDAPFGSYTLTEATPPEGYMAIEAGIVFRVDESGVRAASYQVKEPSEKEPYYTIIVPNNPGVELPATGGSGVGWLRLLGMCLMAISGIAFYMRKRYDYHESA